MAPLAVSRTGLLKSFLLGLAILLASAAALQARHASKPTILWGGTVSLLVLLLALSTKLPLFVRGVAVEFTREGLTDYTTNLGFIAWSEIVSAHRKVYWFGDYVEFELKDADAVIARQPWFMAWGLKSSMRHGLPGASIRASWVSGGAEAVFARLRTMVPTVET